MRRIHLISFTLLLASCVSTPVLPPSSSVANVDYAGGISVGKDSKLLHWSDGRFYLAQKDGAIKVVDKSGQQLATLAGKNKKGEKLLQRPSAIATHGDTIYVVDNESEQVLMFSARGEFKGSFGGDSGEMELSSPRGIAIHDGVIYVADTGNSQIQLYGINGVFLSVLDINKNRKNQQAADKNSIPFKLDEPVDVDVDAIGRIYVLDEDDALVKIYDQNGRYLNRLSTSGEPIAVAISKSGIFVANRASFTINKYGYDFKLDSTFGSKGKGRAQFMSLSGLAANGGKKIYVGDAEAGTVHQFSTEAGEPLRQWQRQATRTSIQLLGQSEINTTKFVWHSKSLLFAIDPEQRAILKVQNGEVVKRIKFKGINPVAIAKAHDGALLVVDKEQKRVIKLSTSGKLISSFGSSGSGAGQFNDPVDIVVASSGLIFVADRDNEWVQVFNSEGIFLNVIRDTIEPDVSLDDPAAIALDSEDNLYVLDRGRNTVSIFSARGKAKGNFVRSKETDTAATFSDPIDLMVSANEVLLLEKSGVKVYTLKGELLRTWGVSGKGMGQFSNPTSLSAIDPFSFSVADADSKRLQHFTTHHKPAAVSELSAEGGMHAVKLQWSALTLPFIDHYQIYRAQSEEGVFAPVTTTTEPHYLDKGLVAERDYYYRVSAVSNHDYEGTLKAVASATTGKYVPTRVEKLQAVPYIWQVKLNWTPLDESYSSSYRIYKMNGEGYSKIGESSTGEFVVGSLNPESDYTFYVSAISSDGIESERVAATATTMVATTTPLEIEVLEMKDVFSNTYKVYEKDGIGKIRLSNNTGDTMQNIKVDFTLKNFMDYPTGSQVKKLEPGESTEITLKAVFNNNILNVTEDTPVQTELVASYFENGVEKSFSKNHSISIYEKHRLSWDDHDRFASFITPKDPVLLNYVRAVATQFKDNRIKAQWAAAVFNSFGVLGLTYIQDPTNPYQVTSGQADFVDYIQYPRETLERKSGDCDDLVALYSAALESLGVETRVVEVPGHMLMMFNTGINAGTDGYTMEDMYVEHQGMLWIPVETTLVGGSFLKAWEMGSQNYYKWQGQGLNLLNIQQSWQTYKPASLPQSQWKPASISRESIEKDYPGEYMSVLKIGIQTQIRGHQKAIKQNPDNLDAHLQIGIIYAKAGDRKEAMKYFDKIIATEPGNAAAHNSRGNVLFLNGELEEAANAYLAATQAEADDANLWVNLAKAYKGQKLNDKAKAAFVKAVEIDATMKKKHRVMALELLNTL